MKNCLRRGIAPLTLCALVASPLSAQYAAHVVVSGGSNAGAYDMRSPSCSIDGLSHLSMIDTSAAGHANRLERLGLTPSTFTLDFARVGGAKLIPASTGVDASHLDGIGELKLTYVYGNVTFRATYTGRAIEGADSVHVAATIGCKGVKRLP